MLTLYGIPNCDSCRNARKWLEGAGVTYHFHDLRADGVTKEMLDRWLAEVEWKSLLNTRSTTWRGLSDEDKSVADAEQAKALMREHPTLIKRPVAEDEGKINVGFSPELYTGLIA